MGIVDMEQADTWPSEISDVVKQLYQTMSWASGVYWRGDQQQARGAISALSWTMR